MPHTVHCFSHDFPGMPVVLAQERNRYDGVRRCRRRLLATLWETCLDLFSPESFHVHVSFLGLTSAGLLCDTAHRETLLPDRLCVVARLFWPTRGRDGRSVFCYHLLFCPFCIK